MSDPKWQDIFATKQRLVLPGVPPRARPIPPEGPTCPEFCSGRHEHDGWLMCRKCGGRISRVVLHEFAHRQGHYFTSLEPKPDRLPVCCNSPMLRVMR